MTRGPEPAVVGTDLLIIEIATGAIVDVLKDALLGRPLSTLFLPLRRAI
jgi:hypothetical protein